MRRLRELDPPASPIEADAIDLLRTAVGHEPPAGQKQRVRARILQQRVSARPAVFRPLVVAAVILCGAVASAAAGRHWIAARVQSLKAPTVNDRATLHSRASVRTSDRNFPGNAANSADIEPMAVAGETPLQDVTAGPEMAPVTPSGDESISATDVPAPRAQAGNERDHDMKRGTGIVRKTTLHKVPTRRTIDVGRKYDDARSANVAASAGGNDEGVPPGGNNVFGGRNSMDTGLVYEGMRALRQDRAPARAASLLYAYLRLHPDGALAEEALALSVEAARVRGDARAQNLARQYLSRYPTGHFRGTVEVTRARPSP